MYYIAASPGRRELVVVVQGALYACPWGALAGDAREPLCERYALLVAPALKPLRHRHVKTKSGHEQGGHIIVTLILIHHVQENNKYV